MAPWADAQDGQSGGLPRAVGAQQPEAFPRFDAKAWEPGRSPGPEKTGPGLPLGSYLSKLRDLSLYLYTNLIQLNPTDWGAKLF